MKNINMIKDNFYTFFTTSQEKNLNIIQYFLNKLYVN